MHGTKAGGESEDELSAFEFGEPFGNDGRGFVIGGGDDAGGTRRSEFALSEASVGGEGSLAVAEDLAAVLAQKDEHGDAMPAVHGEHIANFGDGIAIEEA